MTSREISRSCKAWVDQCQCICSYSPLVKIQGTKQASSLHCLIIVLYKWITSSQSLVIEGSGLRKQACIQRERDTEIFCFRFRRLYDTMTYLVHETFVPVYKIKCTLHPKMARTDSSNTLRYLNITSKRASCKCSNADLTEHVPITSQSP